MMMMMMMVTFGTPEGYYFEHKLLEMQEKTLEKKLSTEEGMEKKHEGRKYKPPKIAKFPKTFSKTKISSYRMSV